MLDKTWKDENGKLIAYVWPGGYPVAYIVPCGDTLCPACAQKAIDAYALHLLDLFCQWAQGNEDGWDGPGDIYAANRADLPCGGFIHWEGPPELCADCNCEIESAYGDPNEE